MTKEVLLKHGWMTLLLALGSQTALAGSLDLTNTSSVGCGPEWASDCLPNLVWGDASTLGVHTPGTVPVLTMGASPTSTTKIAVTNKESLAGSDGIEFVVQGRALSASSVVSFEVEYLDANATVHSLVQ